MSPRTSRLSWCKNATLKPSSRSIWCSTERNRGTSQVTSHATSRSFAVARARSVSVPRMDISGASAIVTGGASGLGEATARLLAERGAKVVVADLQDDKGEVVAKEVGGSFVHTDVTTEGQVIAAVEAAKDLGPLRVLVNCAGIGWPQRTIGKDGEYSSAHGLDIFTKVVTINL